MTRGFLKTLRFFHLINKKAYKKRMKKYTPEYRAIAKSPLFDAKWYLEHNPDVAAAKADPVEHYLTIGWKEDRPTTPYFDGKAYLQMYPDVAKANMNPLAHWLLHGQFEDRYADIHLQEKRLAPFLSVKTAIRNIVTYPKSTLNVMGKHNVDKNNKHIDGYLELKNSSLFDCKFYKKNNAEIKECNIDPIEHYLMYGWKNNRNPSKKFNNAAYLNMYGDVKKAGVCPLLHYIRHGKKEGRKIDYNKFSSMQKKIIKFFKKKNNSFKRILCISHEMTYTGAPISLLQSAECLQKMGYIVRIMTLKEGPLSKEFEEKGMKVQLIDRNMWSLLRGMLCSDVVIVNTIIPYYEVEQISSLMPTIWWIREGSNFADDNQDLKRILKNQKSIYVMSEYSSNEYRYYNSDISVFHHGIPDSYRGIKANKGVIRFAVIGTIGNRKGQDVFINALDKIKEEIECYIVGNVVDGKFYEKIKNMSDRVIFVPEIKDKTEMRNFYEKISCVVVPSREEPTSRVALEAFMMGRPVIMSDHVGAQYALTEGENGYLFKSEDVDDLARCMNKIINDYKVKSFEEQCRKHYIKFNSMECFSKNLNTMVTHEEKKWSNESDRESISVVVPVYNAVKDVKMCLKSLRQAKLKKSTEVIVIDDASSIKEGNFVKKYCKKYNFKYIRNEKNLGFLKTCNKALEIANNDVVVFLNSDTKIPALFDNRVAACFSCDRKIAAASPLCTNSGFFNIKETLFYDFKKTDALINKKISPKYPLFTPEGFCFCVRKNIAKTIGLFDEVFECGYCEEDDFDLRAIKNGYKTVLIDNLLVYHKRHASFGSTRRKIALEKNKKIFNKRWGTFLRDVRNDYDIDNTIKIIYNNIETIKRTKKLLSYILFPYNLLQREKLKRKLSRKMEKCVEDTLHTFRLDVKNVGKSENGISITGNTLSVAEPAWLSNAQGRGKVVTGSSLVQKMTVKAIKDGKLSIVFRGQDKRDKSNVRFPVYIDFTSIKINGNEQLKIPVTVWHDKPFKYEMPVKDGQVVQIAFEQSLHNYAPADLTDTLKKLFPSSNYVLGHMNSIVKTLVKKMPNQKKEAKKTNPLFSVTKQENKKIYRVLGLKITRKNRFAALSAEITQNRVENGELFAKLHQALSKQIVDALSRQDIVKKELGNLNNEIKSLAEKQTGLQKALSEASNLIVSAIHETERNAVKEITDQVSRMSSMLSNELMYSTRQSEEAATALENQMTSYCQTLQNSLFANAKAIERTSERLLSDFKLLTAATEAASEKVNLAVKECGLNAKDGLFRLTGELTRQTDEINANVSETLKEQTADLKSELAVLSKDVSVKQEENAQDLKQKIQKAQTEARQNYQELNFADLLHDTTLQTAWLKDKSFTCFRGAANYGFLYTLFRVLDNANPQTILEMGMGQTSKLTTQYAAFKHPDAKLDIVENDKNWIDLYSAQLAKGDNIRIHHQELEFFTVNGIACRKYADMTPIVQDTKYQLIVVDGPFGADQPQPRTNIIGLVDNNLADDFVIIFDDAERAGEQDTIRKTKQRLSEKGIKFVEDKRTGIKTQVLLLSESRSFINFL